MQRTEGDDMQVKKNNEHGMTLMEILIVMVIIGIMSTMASLGYDIVRKQRLSSATRELVADIQQTRVDALTSSPTGTTGQGFGIRFVPPTTYVVFTFDDADSSFTYDGAGSNDEKNPQTHIISSQLSIQIINNPTYDVLMYDRTGAPHLYTHANPGVLFDGTTDMIIGIKDLSSGITQCISVKTNSIREGVLSGTICIQQ
jgi:prepilin-type N-terminal cleavage/methylation domain-containing protein